MPATSCFEERNPKTSSMGQSGCAWQIPRLTRQAPGKRHYSDVGHYELQSLDTFPLTQTYRAEDLSIKQDKASSWSRASWRTARFSGWRGGVVACIAATAFVLVLNLVLAIVAATAWNPAQGIATAFEGDCITSSRVTSIIHLAINILSSILLGASNYTMQRLVSPTRSEIDKAHARKKWLDIGIPSVRNLLLINKSRMTLWVLLGLSSVPLHFM
jgi:ABC-type multidrug transport system fused ATPase/permease subunit